MPFNTETAKKAGRKGGKAFFNKYGANGMKKLSKKGHKARWKKQ